jgi:hypothetical protein
MKLYLARKNNGLYMLTKLEPVRTSMVHTDHAEVFVRPGAPVNFQGLCPFSVHALFGVELEPRRMAPADMLTAARQWDLLEVRLDRFPWQPCAGRSPGGRSTRDRPPNGPLITSERAVQESTPTSASRRCRSRIRS